MTSALLTQQVTIERRTFADEDAYGNTTLETSATYTVRGYLEQTDSTEVTVGRETVVSNWRAVFPAGTSLDAGDRVVYAGQTFEVIGAPARLWNPRTRAEQHVEVRLAVTAR